MRFQTKIEGATGRGGRRPCLPFAPHEHQQARRPAATGGIRFAMMSAMLVLFSTAHAAETVALSGRAMGTTWSAKFVQPEQALVQTAVQSAIANRLEQLEQLFSTYRPNSTLSRFNAANTTDWISVPTEMAELATLSRTVSELTAGAYDVTVHPLVQLWGFAAERRADSLPAPADIAAARALVDFRLLDVRMNPPALRKNRRQVTVDFSSMTKGFAVDSISELLTRLGAANHLVQIAGDMKSAGMMSDGRHWHAGIEDGRSTLPTREPSPVGSRGIASVIELRSAALSTSGNYRNFFELGGRRYGHVIDPRSGRPVSGPLVSVSVVHSSAAMSSALATAFFVLGADDGFRLANEQKLACLFQVRSGVETVQRATPEFERLTNGF